MKTHLIFCLLVISFSSMNAQTHFTYDLSGNRTARKTIVLPPPPAPALAGVDMDSLVTLQQPETVYKDKLNENDVVIYPNPTQGALAVEIRDKDPKNPHHLMVFTINGRTVFQRDNIGDYTQIDLSSQPKGVYLLRISSQDSAITWRIIKQ